MVSFSHILVVASAIAGSLAAPAAEVSDNPNFVLGAENNLVRRQSYSTDYTTGGSVNYSPGSAGSYSVSFSGASDFVVGKGWNPGSARTIDYSGSFSATSGTVLLSIYGWFTDPLVEYYIVEDYTSAPSGGTSLGTVTSDGGTYEMFETTRTNEPSIEGTSTFHQYWSVRTSKRTSGTVTTANHFNAWKAAGLTLGTFNLQVLATEGYNSASGSVSQTFSG
jgi:endo-1,4-beta-xylanase